MAVVLSPILQESQFDSTTGEFLSGGTITWYLNNTSNFQATYTDAAGFVPHTNPIVLNARGEPPSQIWLTDGVVYKAVLKDALGSVITTYTDIIGVGTSSVTQQEWQSTSIVPTFVSETSFTVPGDNTALLHAGRRLKLTVTAGIIYATIRSSSYAAPDTTIIIYNDSGVLDAGLSEFSYSVLSALYPATPGNLNAQIGNVFRRNMFDNGDLDIWQRGTTFAGAGVTADRWRIAAVGSTFIATKIDVALGNYAIDEGDYQPTSYIEIDVTGAAGAANFLNFKQRVESVITLNNKWAVITFWARVTAGTANVSVEISQNFGSGGAPSAEVTAIGVKKVTLSTTFQKFVVPFFVPSISGKTLGTDNNDALVCNFWLDAGSDFDARTNTLGHQTKVFRLARFQLEPGQIPSIFEKRAYYEEITNCRRFFRKSFPFLTAPANGGSPTGSVRGIATLAGAVTNYFPDIRLDPPMRGDPTLVFWSASAAALDGEAYNATDAAGCTGTTGTATSDTLKWQCTGNAACSLGDRINVHYTLDAEL